MFWIFSTVVFLIIMLIGIYLYNNLSYDRENIGTAIGWIGGVLFVISLVVLCCCFFFGINRYPDLKAKYKAIELRRARLEEIKSSVYTYPTGGNQPSLVNGFLENMKHSTNVSYYISELSDKEAFYFYTLDKSKTRKENFILLFFTEGFFISNKIYELPIR